MTLIRHVLAISLALAAVTGCAKKEDPGLKEIRQAVWRYDEALIRVYNELDPKPLYGLASEKEIGKVRMIIWRFMGEKKIMESRLNDLKFVRIEKKGRGSAEVETLEKWRFRHLREGTGEEVMPWTEKEYSLTFEMLRQDGKWIVDSSKLTGEEG